VLHPDAGSPFPEWAPAAKSWKPDFRSQSIGAQVQRSSSRFTPRKQTCAVQLGMSAKCQKRTFIQGDLSRGSGATEKLTGGSPRWCRSHIVVYAASM
jgi:hypothetical protein